MNLSRLLSITVAGFLALHSTLQAAVIDIQPSPDSVTEGGTINLAVTASLSPGATGLSFQWRKNGVLIPGATLSVLTITNAKKTDETTYTVYVQDSAGGVLSNPPTPVTVNLKPQVTKHPTARTVNQGLPTTFTVDATGAIPLTYQWQKLIGAVWTDIAGAITKDYTIPAVTPADAADYRVIVNNITMVPATSNKANLKVNTIPVITTQPTVPLNPLPIAVGATGTLKVVVAGFAPLTYQWFKEIAGVFTPIANAKAATLTVKGDATGPGNYRVQITNAISTTLGVGPTISNTVAVAVDAKPTITTHPLGGTFAAGTNPVTLAVVAGGADPFITYQWQLGGKNITGPARFNCPSGVVVDGAGNIFVTDFANHTIRMITPAGVVSTFAGAAGISGSTDDTGTAARFSSPLGIAIDSLGNFYVADSVNHTIRKITPAGVVTTFAGTAGLAGATNETGALARFNRPTGVAVDSLDNVYVTDYNNNTIRKITPAGVVTTLAGSALPALIIGAADGNGAAASFNKPLGIAVDGADNLYVTDSGNHSIRMITPAGDVTTFSGLSGTAGKVNGTLAAARYNTPTGITVDGAGVIYVVEALNHALRRISGGVVTTLAGTLGTSGFIDDLGAKARFNGPAGVAVDAAGNLIVTDCWSHTIRRSSIFGLVSTLAGSAQSPGSRDGAAAANSATLELGPIQWTDRGVYQVIVRNRVGSITSKTATIVVNSRPVILKQPTSAKGATGGSVTFEVIAGGNTPLTYQWFFKPLLGAGFTAITGAKANKLTLTKLAEANEGSFFCRVTNNFPAANTSVDTLEVTLVVDDAPKVISVTPNPVGKKIRIGGTFTLTANTTGADTKTYEWRRNNVSLGAPTSNPVLTITGGLASQTGTYTVIVRNDVGTATSLGVLMSVLAVPNITTDPAALTNTVEGVSTTLTVVATGAATLKYQWRKFGVDMPGKTAASLTLPNTGLTDADGDDYTCFVYNDVGSDLSAVATVIVGVAPIPSFLRLTPRQARVGERVRIFGTGLQYTTGVKFGPHAGTVVIESPNSILVSVPGLNPTPTGDPGTPITVTTRGGSFTTIPNLIVVNANTAPNDLPSNATILVGNQPGYGGSNIGLTGEPESFGYRKTAWFTWICPQTDRWAAQAYGNNLANNRLFDIVVGVYEGPIGGPYTTLVGFADDFGATGQLESAEAVFLPTQGMEYLFFVGGYPWPANSPTWIDEGFYSLNIVKPPVQPAVAAKFEADEGFQAGQSVVGQAGWQGQGDTATAAIVAADAAGEGQEAVLGGVPSDEGAVIWPSVPATASDADQVTVGVAISFDTPVGSSSDQFNWTLYDSNEEPVGAVWFNQTDGSIYATQADGTVVSSIQHFGADSTYQLDMDFDAEAGTWGALLNGVPIFGGMSLPEGSQFGDVSAGWVPGSSGAPASMSIDNVDIGSERH